jgi:hypothetical protein
MKAALLIAIAALVLGCSACFVDDRGLPAEMMSMSRSQPAGAEKSLDATVRFDIGSIEIAADKAGSVYTLDLDYDKSGYEPEVRYEAGERGQLAFNLRGTHQSGIRTDAHQNRARLNFSQGLPLALRINSGVGETRLALTGMQVSSLNLEAGVGEARLSMYEPNAVVCDTIRVKNGVGHMSAVGLGNLNFHDLEFEGGVGGASLDFSGNWKQDANVRIQVGVGGVKVLLPRDIGVRVDAEKNFLSGIHLEDFTKRDSVHYSDNYDKARIRVSFRVATGIGGFRVSWL